MKSKQTRFIQALTECQEALRGYCYAKTRIWADAEDVMQKTNLKLWELEADWDRERPFLPWALGVARITVLSHYRDRQRDRLVFDEDVMELMEKPLRIEAEKTPELVLAMRHCLGRIEAKPREILKAHYLEGWSLGEIAESVGRSVSGIKSLLFRLRRELASCIEKEMRT